MDAAPAALVLRDRTNADPHQVLTAAIDALVADGVWTSRHGWRRLRRVETLTPRGAAPTTEPLRTADALLRCAAVDDGTPLAVRDAARWAAVHGRDAVDTIVRRTLDDLLARGLLVREGTRLRATAAGERLLNDAAPPPAVRPTAHDELVRIAAFQVLSRRARVFLEAYRSVRQITPAPELSAPGGDNRRAAIWTGSGVL